MEHTTGPHYGSLFFLFGILREKGGSKIMTGYTVHTGSNDNFRDGWDEIFSDGKKKPAPKQKTRGKSQARAKKSPGQLSGKSGRKKR